MREEKITEMSVGDHISELEAMWQEEDRSKVLDWVKYAAFLHEHDSNESSTLKDKLRELYLPLSYVRNNFSPDILKSVMMIEMMGDEIIHAAMLYQSGKTKSEVNDLIGEDRLVGGYIPKGSDEQGSLSVIKIVGMDDRIFLTENESADRILDGAHCAGAVHLLTGMRIDMVLMQPKVVGITVKSIDDGDLIRAIEATCAGSTAIDTMTVYNSGNDEIEQRKTAGMTKEEVSTFLHPDIGGDDESMTNILDIGGN